MGEGQTQGTRLLLLTVPQVHPSAKPVTRLQSPYEEQLEQQRLAVQRAEEAQRLREEQEALHQQRLQGHLLRQHQQQQLLARETARQQQDGLQEGRLQRPKQPR